VSAVACDAHDKLDLLCVHGVVRAIVVLPSLEFFFVDHDDAVVLVRGPLLLVVGLTLLLAVESFCLALFAALADDDGAAVLGVASVVFGNVGDGYPTWAPWGRLVPPRTAERTFQAVGVFDGGCQHQGELQASSAVVLLVGVDLFSAGHLLWFGQVLAGEADPLVVGGKRVHGHSSLDLCFGPVLVFVEGDEDLRLVDWLGYVDGGPAVVCEGVVARLGRAGLALVAHKVAGRVCVAKDKVVWRRGRVGGGCGVVGVDKRVEVVLGLDARVALVGEGGEVEGRVLFPAGALGCGGQDGRVVGLLVGIGIDAHLPERVLEVAVVLEILGIDIGAIVLLHRVHGGGGGGGSGSGSGRGDFSGPGEDPTSKLNEGAWRGRVRRG